MKFSLPKKIKNEEQNKPEVKKYSFFAILFSVFAAFLLWFYVQEAESPDYDKTFSPVSVEIQSLSPSLSVLGVEEISVDITLKGKRSDLNKIKADDLEAYLDLSSVTQAGDYYLDVNVLVPSGAEMVDCFPKVVTLSVDSTVSVSVPVEVEFGQYSVGENVVLEATPAVNEVLVKGPKTILDRVVCAKISTGKLGNVSESFESVMQYRLCDQNGNEVKSNYISQTVRSVRVSFSLCKTKSVPLVVQSKNGWWKSENMRYSISPKTVMIKGSPSRVDAVEWIPALIVDETTLDANELQLSLVPDQLVLPAGISLAETLGDVDVKLTLTDNQATTLWMQLNSTHVAVTPPRGGMSYQFVEQNLSFKVRGTTQEVRNANANDFYLNIDLSSCATTGEFDVPVQIVQTDASIGKIYPVGEYSVKVIIE